MKTHIVCLGDSNTHGYCADPADCADGGIRFNEEERWTKRLQTALGDEYLVLEEGLSGRTTVFPDHLYEGLDALHYLWPCLKSHEYVFSSSQLLFVSFKLRIILPVVTK